MKENVILRFFSFHFLILICRIFVLKKRKKIKNIQLFSLFFLSINLLFTSCIESRESTRSKRGKAVRSSNIKLSQNVKQPIDSNDSDQILPEIQPSFLSESVRKYLELGRAIPGNK